MFFFVKSVKISKMIGMITKLVVCPILFVNAVFFLLDGVEALTIRGLLNFERHQSPHIDYSYYISQPTPDLFSQSFCPIPQPLIHSSIGSMENVPVEDGGDILVRGRGDISMGSRDETTIGDRADSSMEDGQNTPFAAVHVEYRVLDDVILYQTFTGVGCHPFLIEQLENQALFNKFFDHSNRSRKGMAANFVEWVVDGYLCKIELFSEVDCEGDLIFSFENVSGVASITPSEFFRSFKVECRLYRA